MKNYKRLKREFFERKTLFVAKSLLGKYIVRKYRGKLIAGKIVETEVYIGPKDKASHAFGGKITKRNLAEYMRGGHIYIYLVYGMYWQLNISTYKSGRPECVLLRALEPEKGNCKLANGPGKLCNYLKLDKNFYGEDVVVSKRIWLEDRGVKVSKNMIVSSSRIGIDYAGPYWSKVPWRFYIKDNKCVSKT